MTSTKGSAVTPTSFHSQSPILRDIARPIGSDGVAALLNTTTRMNFPTQSFDPYAFVWQVGLVASTRVRYADFLSRTFVARKDSATVSSVGHK